MSGLEASLLLGSVHGLSLAIVLQRRERNRRANQYLAALLGALALLLFDGFLRARGVLTTHPHLIGLTAWVPFVLAPLNFLYVREMTAPAPLRNRPPWRHFAVPIAYVVLLVVTFFPRSASYKLDVAKHGGAWFINAIEIGLLVYGIAYAIAALVLLRRHRANVQDIYSNLRGVSLRWLLVLSSLSAVVWIAALVAFVIRMTGIADASASSLIVPIGSTITVFVVGYFQLGQTEIYAGQAAAHDGSVATHSRSPELVAAPSATDMIAAPIAAPPSAPIEASAAAASPASAAASAAPASPSAAPAAPSATPATPSATPTAPKPPSYQRARLAEPDAAAVEARMKAAMTEQRLYQRAGLTLGELADEVAATPHEVSQVLSTRLQRNFYTFVNEHRIEHVKAALRTSDRPVLDLAFEAGFQSKSTFNSAFRKATGTTPREFRERVTS